MSERELLSAIRRQLDRVPWIHTLRAPAASEQLRRLPLSLRGLYAVTDGIDIRHIKYRDEIVGTELEVLPVNEVIPIDQAMYGPRSQSEDWAGREWLAVVRASDAHFYIAIDPRMDTFYSVRPIVREEFELIAASSDEYFTWLLGCLPSTEQLDRASGQGAA